MVNTLLASEITTEAAGDILEETTDSNGGRIKNIKGNLSFNGFLITGDENNYMTLSNSNYAFSAGSPSKNYQTRFKGSKGNQYYKSIGFTIDKPAELYIVGSSDSGNNARNMALAKLDENKQLKECVGVTYSKGTTSSIDGEYSNDIVNNLKYAEGGIELTGTMNGSAANYLNIELTEAGTYYIYAANSGIRIYEVTVAYESEDKDYNITIDKSNVSSDAASIYDGSKTTAKAGETVVLEDIATVYPYSGYELTEWKVTRASGAEVTVLEDPARGWVFTMPKGNVTVTPVIMPITVEKPEFNPVTAGSNRYEFATTTGEVTITTATKGAEIVYVNNQYFVEEVVDLVTFEDITAENILENYNANKSQQSASVPVREDNTIIKAIAVKGDVKSELVTYTYDVNENGINLISPPMPIPGPGEVEQYTRVTFKSSYGASMYAVEKEISEPAPSRAELVVDANKDKRTFTIDKDKIIYAMSVEYGKNSDITGESEIAAFKYTVDAASIPELQSVRLDGEAKIKRTLTAIPVFKPEQTIIPPDITYKWYREGEAEPISGADENSYKLTKDDEGKTIKVVVTYNGVSKEAASEPVVENPDVAKGEGFEIEFNDGTEYTYTGAKITPSITVTNYGNTLVEGVDYTVKYTNNIKAGKPSGTTYDKKAPGITVTGKGNFSGKTSANFTINPRKLADTVKGDIVVVSGSKASVVLLYNGTKLTAKDYVVTYPENFKTKRWTDEEGGDTIIIKGKGNFSDKEEDAITLDVSVITRDEAKYSKISAKFEDPQEVANLTYDGTEHKPAITVTNNNHGEDAVDLDPDSDYVISYSADTTSAGTKKVTILGISSNCIGSVTKSYTVKPAKGGKLQVVDGIKDSYDFVSTGVTFGDEVKVSYVDTAKNINIGNLTQGVDYKITYTNNNKAGTAKYAITGLGNYKGLNIPKTNFIIKGLALSNTDNNIKVIAGDKVFDKPGVYKSVPTVIVNGELVKASEYTVSYKVGDETAWSSRPSRIESIGEDGYVSVKVQIKAKNTTGNYGGAVSAEDELEGEYKVVSSTARKDLAKAKITFYTKDGAKVTKVGYTGNAVTPYKAVISCKDTEDVSIILDGAEADYEAKGFEVTYANNKLKGKATIVIKAKDGDGNPVYAGSKTATFGIAQKNLQKDLDAKEGFLKSAVNSFFKTFFN